MSTNGKQRIWIILDHPQQFATALGIVSYLKRGDFFLSLLISPHTYWAKVDINLYNHLFDNIYFLDRPDYSWNPIKVPSTIFKIFRLKRKIKQLGILQNDVIIGLSIFHYLENIIISMYPKNRKIGIMPYVVYQESTREMNRMVYENTFEGLLANWIIEPISGLHQTYCMKDKQHPDAYWRIRYKKSLQHIYDEIIILGNFVSENNHREDNINTMPFPYILAFGKMQNENSSLHCPKKIVFFGDSFRNGIRGVSSDDYKRHLNKCLSFLRNKYGATYKLIYRPHPIEKSEIGQLDLDQFEIENDGMLAELYFYQNMNDIYAVFSVGSNVSRSAIYFFINAYSFLDIFPFDDAAIDSFRQEMGNVPEEFYISDLSINPTEYIKMESLTDAKKTCQNVLDIIMKHGR